MNQLRYASHALWQRIVAVDESLHQQICSLERAWITPFMRGITRTGDMASWIVFCLLLLAMGESTRRYFVYIATACLAGSLAAKFLKILWRRPRPCDGADASMSLIEIPDKYSFPSGHTATVFAVCAALPEEGTLLVPFFVGWALLIGVSRIYLRAHYPLDVLVGMLVGAASGWLVKIGLVAAGIV